MTADEHKGAEETEPAGDRVHDPAAELEARVEATLDPPAERGPARGRWVWIAAMVVALVIGVVLHDPVTSLLGVGAGAGGQGPAESTQKYTCGMHPEIVQDEPGFCPICEMKLTPVKPEKKGKKKIVTGQAACKDREILYYQAPMDPNYRSPEPGKSPMGMDLVPACEGDELEAEGGISIDPRIRQNMGIQTTAVTKGPLIKEIRTYGHVDYDERRLAIINTKIEGWVERLYVDFTGQRVRRGQPLLAIYSPKLISTQQELLLAHRQVQATGSRRDRVLLQAAEKRLAYWDVSQKQIDQIEKSGEIMRRLTIYAPMSGVVVHKNVVEGMHVESGSDLFKVADLSRVWIYAHLYEMDVPFVKVGQKVVVHLPYTPGSEVEGRVDYIFPWLDKKTRDVKARLVFNNKDGLLKPEMYASVTIQADLKEQALLVDDAAVLRSGLRNVVFVDKGGGTFEPREIELGRQVEGSIEVRSGLEAGEEVVVNGQFMLDSESRLKESLQKFEAAAKEVGGQANHPPGHDHADPGSGGDAAKRISGDPAKDLDALEAKGCTYTCPMPEHFYVCGHGPGECIDCGMTLKPISEVRARFAPGPSDEPAAHTHD